MPLIVLGMAISKRAPPKISQITNSPKRKAREDICIPNLVTLWSKSSLRLLTSHNEICGGSHDDKEYRIDPREERYKSRLVLIIIGDETERERTNEAPGVRWDGVVCHALSGLSRIEDCTQRTLSFPVFPSKYSD